MIFIERVIPLNATGCRIDLDFDRDSDPNERYRYRLVAFVGTSFRFIKEMDLPATFVFYVGFLGIIYTSYVGAIKSSKWPICCKTPPWYLSWCNKKLGISAECGEGNPRNFAQVPNLLELCMIGVSHSIHTQEPMISCMQLVFIDISNHCYTGNPFFMYLILHLFQKKR
ncbi:hypothetical protein L1987_24279 [Smallanthus sonchifolius]|uniref:Uncharacterized protein n=1 Tax=Smallanthus sonchifolius TaxID=185202 RepID=A0ACB9ILH5_9ASTR|nr:hypothetical protein L1987_24279 [Smallanthus sonchifolius]